MHGIITTFISVDKSIYICVLLLIFLLWRYHKVKDKDLIYFFLSCASYTLGEVCYDFLDLIIKFPIDLIFFFLFYYFIFLFFRQRTRILLKNPIMDKSSDIKTWLLIFIDFLVFAALSYLLYYLFDRVSISPQSSEYSLNLITVSNFIYPIFDFLILGYFISINKKYIMSDRKLYLPLISGISVWAIGDFLIAYEEVYKAATYEIGNYLQMLGLIILTVILSLIKTSKTDSYYTTIDLYRRNSRVENYNLLIYIIIALYFLIYIYCSVYASFFMDTVRIFGIIILLLGFLRQTIINYDIEYKLNNTSKDAITDPLTELYSRKYAFTLLNNLYKSSLYFGIKISVLMLDIDFFKKYNDTYGHVNGDYVLKEISQVITSSIDTSNIVCRYGGEEFMIVLPGADEKTGIQIADRIRENIENYVFRQSSKITISIGGATSGKAMKEAADLIEQADTALYNAKKERNKCSWFDSGS